MKNQETYNAILVKKSTKQRLDKVIFSLKAKGEKITFDIFINQLLDK